jgi:hypothetical protein
VLEDDWIDQLYVAPGRTGRGIGGRQPIAVLSGKSIVRGRAICCTPTARRSTRERSMRQSLMTIQREVSIDLEDMRLNADVELGDPGACRRR